MFFFEKSRIGYFTSLFIIFVTRNLFEKDAPRYYLSDGQTIFKNLLNGAKLWPNYPSATPTRKQVDFQRGCSISMFFGFGVLDFGFWALGFKFWVAGFEFGVLNC